jgi:hypothetical protein
LEINASRVCFGAVAVSSRIGEVKMEIVMSIVKVFHNPFETPFPITQQGALRQLLWWKSFLGK